MTPDLLVAILNFAAKFGLDAAIAILGQAGKPAATIDDAIAALRSIQQKSADDYLAAARAALLNPSGQPAVLPPATPGS